MKRVAVIAKLKPDTAAKAAELVASGPPFDPAAGGFERHAVYLSGDQVIFVFEGGDLSALAQDLARHPRGLAALGGWQPLIEGVPRVATEAYFWEREPAHGSAAWGE